MPIVQEQKFKRKDEEKTAEVLSIKLNRDEQVLLRKAQRILKQPKKGTAFKQLMYIGAEVVFDDKMGSVLKVVLENDRKNQRLGIIDVDEEIVPLPPIKTPLLRVLHNPVTLLRIIQST